MCLSKRISKCTHGHKSSYLGNIGNSAAMVVEDITQSSFRLVPCITPRAATRPDHSWKKKQKTKVRFKTDLHASPHRTKTGEGIVPASLSLANSETIGV